MAIALALGCLSLLAWLAVLAHPARPWRLQPVAEDEPAPAEPPAWPSVQAVVPARNEARYLPLTLPALLAQDYPGELGVLVVDDRSADATAEAARRAGGEVVLGEPLPEGWVGKVWALEQGARGVRADYLLLSDADIRHAPGSLRRLVAEAEAGGLALNSRMARLRCRSAAERLLIPPFVFFFNLLYPMPWANTGRRPAAAGGCLLVGREALERTGGFAAIRDAVIDDLALARRVAAIGGPARLALSADDVRSLREHSSVAGIWRMVARTAFAELRYSWARLAAALSAIAVLCPGPPALVVAGAWLGWPVAGLGAAAWLAQALAFAPAARFFGLSPAWVLSLPLAGTLYAAMTLDSGLGGGGRGRSGRGILDRPVSHRGKG